MIPELVDIGSLWKVLPPGVHNATLDEVEKIFSTPGTALNAASRGRDINSSTSSGLAFV